MKLFILTAHSPDEFNDIDHVDYVLAAPSVFITLEEAMEAADNSVGGPTSGWTPYPQNPESEWLLVHQTYHEETDTYLRVTIIEVPPPDRED